MILPAIKSAILRTTGVVVQEVFTSTDSVAVEMADLVNEVATEIVQSHDWRALTKVHQIVGGGVTGHALPTDYDRMVLASEIDNAASWFWGYHSFDSVNEWMRYTSPGATMLSPGGWIIIGGEIQFVPPPNGTAQFPYISRFFALDKDSARKPAFTADDDIFVLDERLLTLGLIWKWLAQKGMAYAEEMATYEIALARAQSRDQGARVIRSERGRFYGGRRAYSGRPYG